jgi:hypothetical protein
MELVKQYSTTGEAKSDIAEVVTAGDVSPVVMGD